MCGFLLPLRVSAFQTPGTPPSGNVSNTNYNEYGPAPATLWMINYGSYTGELNALKSGTTDWMDEPLLPGDYATLNTAHETTYTFGFEYEFSLDQYDLNVAVNPFNNTAYREAVTTLIDVNKDSWVASELAGGGAPAWSPIACDVPANAGISWYDPSTTTYFVGGYSAAFSLLMSSGLTVIVDPYNSSCFTWQFNSPFPTTGPSGEPAMSNSMVYIFARSDDVPARLDLGTEMQSQLGNAFADWAYSNPTAWTYPAGIPSGLVPRIEVNIYPESHDTCNQWVMVDYNFETYTGGWSLGATPDNMEIWLSEYAAVNYGYTVAYLPNYGSIIDPTFDSDVNAMEASTYIGLPTDAPGTHGPSDTGSGMYWAYQAQEEFASQAWMIPMWVYTEYSPCLTSDYNNINAVGAGFSNWYSFLEAYPTSGSPGYSASPQSMYFGMRGGLVNPNIISASWLWDWYPLGEIYDSLAAGNPYNATQLTPYIASGWNLGTWLNPNTAIMDTTMNITLLNDVFWQPLPAGPGTAGAEPSVAHGRNGFTLDNDSLINGPVSGQSLTALDVAFSLAYYAIGNLFTSVHVGESVSNIDHVVINSWYEQYWPMLATGLPWANETYILNTMAPYGIAPSTDWCPAIGDYETLPQYESSIVQFSPYVSPNQVDVYLSSTMTWLATYRILGVPIIPDYIFSHLALGSWPTTDIQGNPWTTTDVTGMTMTPTSFSSIGADILYGTGPYIWLGQTSVNTWEFIPYVTGASYEGITSPTTYFWQTFTDVITGSYTPGTNYVSWTDTVTIPPSITVNVGGVITTLTPNAPGTSVTWTLTSEYEVWYNTGTHTSTVTGPWGPYGPYTYGFSAPGTSGSMTVNLALHPPAGTNWVFCGAFKGTSTSTVTSTYCNGPPTTITTTITRTITDGAWVLWMPSEWLPGDINRDGIVDVSDLGILGQHWLQTGKNVPGDINGDGIVDVSDLGILGQNWLVTSPPVPSFVVLASGSWPGMPPGYP